MMIPTWGWEVRNTYQLDDTDGLFLLFISQKWHGMLWKHELIIFVPQSVKQDGATPLLSEGSVK
jgi:hypothetical protein